MCAGGIPSPNKSHVFDIVEAGLAMQEFIREKNERRKTEGLPPWEVRIGIHVGPVVAGVVGKKKYAYDIWGSTVNIASRIETGGIAGHVNISDAVYNLIRHEYNCIHRGKIYAKNVGDIDMYLIDSKKKNQTKVLGIEENSEIRVERKQLIRALYE
jgi:class 3 adenylate cyclase